MMHPLLILQERLWPTGGVIWLLPVYLLAVALSFPFNSGMIARWYAGPDKDGGEGKGIFEDVSFFPAAAGTFLAFVLAFQIYKLPAAPISLLGDLPDKNLLIAVIPLVTYALAGVTNDHGINGHLYGGALYAIVLFYAFLEELFWRGFLQNLYYGENLYLVNALIGVLWWAWHGRFRTRFDFFVFPFICIAGSILIGIAAYKTNSILVAAGLHAIVVLVSVSSTAQRRKTLLLSVVNIIAWRLVERYYQP